jgi:hypothetical protein
MPVGTPRCKAIQHRNVSGNLPPCGCHSVVHKWLLGLWLQHPHHLGLVDSVKCSHLKSWKLWARCGKRWANKPPRWFQCTLKFKAFRTLSGPSVKIRTESRSGVRLWHTPRLLYCGPQEFWATGYESCYSHAQVAPPWLLAPSPHDIPHPSGSAPWLLETVPSFISDRETSVSAHIAAARIDRSDSYYKPCRFITSP